jgi:putative Holliday junction resolvase
VPSFPAGGRLLAIDYGRRRLGLALSDELACTVRPLTTLKRAGRGNDLARLAELARRYQVAGVVVGYPLNLQGDRGTLTAEVERFARRLQQILQIPVELFDERLTTWEATRWRAEHPRSARRNTDDAIAAAILLRSFLAERVPRSG